MHTTSQRGQASIEMIAVLPLVILVGIALWQLVLAGHTLWLTANAARVAARAEAVGEDTESAARSALPEVLERGMTVTDGSDAVEVRVRVPFVIQHWQTPVPVAASAHLEAES